MYHAGNAAIAIIPQTAAFYDPKLQPLSIHNNLQMQAETSSLDFPPS